jgi:hypothetical protein
MGIRKKNAHQSKRDDLPFGRGKCETHITISVNLCLPRFRAVMQQGAGICAHQTYLMEIAYNACFH